MAGFAFACLTMMALQFPPIPVEEIFDSCYPPKADCDPVTISTINPTSTKIVTKSTTETSNITTSFPVNSTNSTNSTLSTRSTEPSTRTSGSVSSTSTTTSTTSSTTTTSTFTSSPSPPLSPMAVNISECGCNVPNLYLDIMFVVSTANDLSPGDVQAIEFYLESALLEMTLGQGIQQVTRIGLVVYSDSAQLVFPLSSFNSTADFFANFNIPIPASPMNRNNLYEGLFLAKAELDDKVRQGFQPVIVIITQTFDPNTPDPGQTAASFKRYGRIITIQYFAEHGTESDFIQQITDLASPNYNLSNRNRTLHVSQLHDLFCEANCYCPAYWQIYKSDLWKSPTMGCYKMATDSRFVTYSQAQKTCRSDNGALASLEDPEKANWIQKIEHNIYAQWIGLVCDGENCTWDDLTKFNFDLFETPLNANAGQLCAIQTYDETQSLAWSLVSCSTQLQNFTCERRACASDFFCINSNSQFLRLPFL